MRGSFLHNSLVAQIERAYRGLGASVSREYRIATRSLDGFVDLLIIYNLLRIVIEVELTTDRVRWDVLKAGATNADLLLIIMPNSRLARAAQERVDELKASEKTANLPVYCLTLGAALERLTDPNGFVVGLNVPPTLIQQIPKTQSQPPQLSAKKGG